MLRNPLLVPDLRELIQAGETAALRDFFGRPPPGARRRDHRGPRRRRGGRDRSALLPDRLRADGDELPRRPSGRSASSRG